MKELPSEVNEVRQQLLLEVLVRVEGREVTHFRIQQAMEKSTIPFEKANLKRELARLPSIIK